MTVGWVLGQVSPATLVGLAAVWIAGLWAHSFVLAASLPGLTKRRALTLSLTGSAVANVLPLGGAACTGLNFAMTSRWGFSPSAFAGFLTVTQPPPAMTWHAVIAQHLQAYHHLLSAASQLRLKVLQP
jgi:putative heme transporter